MTRWRFVWQLSTLLALVHPASAGAQPATLVRDLNQVDDAYYSGQTTVDGLRAAGNRLYFLSDAGNAGQELWTSDGTPTGTGMVRDVCPGLCSSEPRILEAIGPVLYWTAKAESGTRQLWRTDGTRAGTFPLTDPALTVGSTYDRDLRSWQSFAGALYFVGCTPESGLENCDLWRSDGTAEGTRVYHPEVARGAVLAAAGGRLFLATASDGGTDLWSVDGTAPGAVLLRHFDYFYDSPGRWAVAGNRLFFVARDQGLELWTSDGTAAGTRAVSSFGPEVPFPYDSTLRASGGRVHFVADDGIHGDELWRSDGTPAGTVRLSDFAFDDPFGGYTPSLAVTGSATLFSARTAENGDLSFWLKRNDAAAVERLPVDCGDECAIETTLVESSGRVYFRVDRDYFDVEVWVTQGTAASTRRLTTACDRFDCLPGPLVPWGAGGLLFLRQSGNRLQIWSSDGTAAGTRPLTHMTDGQPAESLQVARVGESAYFIGATEGEVSGLWAFDAAGKTRVVQTYPWHATASLPSRLTGLGDRLLFVAQEDRYDYALWSTLGTEATTAKLGPSNVDWEEVSDFVRVGNLVYFQLGSSYSANNLWRTDGTEAGTFVVAHLQTRAPMVPFQGGLDVFDGGWIWHTDGTVAGTVKTGDLPAQVTGVLGAVAVPGGMVVEGYGSSSYYGDLYLSDGTTAGTRKFFERQSGSSGTPAEIVSLGGQIYFLSGGLWKSDGTEAGTVSLSADVVPPYFELSHLTVFQGKLYFLTRAGYSDSEAGLWRSEGTKESTVRLAGFVPRSGAGLPLELVAAGNRLFFPIDDGVHGSELWSSDGTADGTALVRDLVPGAASSGPRGLTVAGGRLYFSAADPIHGTELWQSDGSPDGTRMVQDIGPQFASSCPEHLTVAGDQLYFVADDGLTGRELWALPLFGAAACRPSATRLCLSDGRYAVEATWTDPRGNRGAGHAASLTADTGTFWFFDPANVEVVLKVLDGSGVNGHRWVFYGALSNVEYELTVTDTQTGLAHRYRNPQGNLASVGDTRAFGPEGASLASVTTVASASKAGAPLALASRKVVPRAATGACAPSSTRLCLNGSRYAVEVAWKDFAGTAGTGQAQGLTADTGWFWFFDPANVELVLKVLDGTPVNGHRWVFYGALSSVEYTVTVTDTETGEVSTYHNASGSLASVADTMAF